MEGQDHEHQAVRDFLAIMETLICGFWRTFDYWADTNSKQIEMWTSILFVVMLGILVIIAYILR